ncbi:radical SAM protein [Achromobacter sp. GG226]|uniref:radical SAM protein n=1 Tax=Verticiella alkaliphila TaxID=2779529 RepID=UPI001C0CE3F9|nr:radical SAM protein [Verticiella sp. GG226]MBU4612515.1 radical SAM protein [Verticiella sp. GG226]
MTASPRVHVFPPPMDHHYPVQDGRVQTRSLEAHVVDHCNLTCAGCCSLSPLLPDWYADPAQLARDLALAARVLRPRVFKLVGGEPTLHPALPELIQVVKASGIAPKVSVTTNGLKLADMPEAFWRDVDALTISRYPRPRLTDDLVAHVEDQAARFDVSLNWKAQDTFTQMDRETPLGDGPDARALFRDCWIRERCHLIRDGVFYTCTRPAHFQTLHGDTGAFADDGLRLDDEPGMLDTLLAYLQREAPLQACLHCQGGSAPVAPHRMLSRRQIHAIKAAYP